jgi:hypothetical protein
MKIQTALGRAAAIFLSLSAWAWAGVPVIPAGQTFAVSENVPAGARIGTVAATDPDGDSLFLFVVGDSEGWHFTPVPFEFEPGTSNLRTTAMLNLEHRGLWKIYVGATDGGGLPGAVETVEISVSDVATEAIVGIGGETFGEKPAFIGQESILTIGPTSYGALPESRDVNFTLEFPVGALFLGATSDDGWNCSFTAPKLLCVREGIDVGDSPSFSVHWLLPGTPGAISLPYLGKSDDYVHFEGSINQTDVWPHPQPGNLGVELLPEMASAAIGKLFRYTIDVGDSSDPALPPLQGEVVASFNMDPAWGTASFEGTDRSWTCSQQSALVRCTRSGLDRFHKAPPIVISVYAPQSSGTYPVVAWVSGPPDSDTSNNVSRHSTVVHAAPTLNDHTFVVPAGSQPGAIYGPLVGQDDNLPAPPALAYSMLQSIPPSPFKVMADGSVVQQSSVVAGTTYWLQAFVTDGGGLSATAMVSMQVGPGCVGTDTDGDGQCDDVDPDDDNDGVPDGSDPCPLDPQNGCVPPPGCGASGGDTDGDGICNASDPDDDNDGIPDASDPCPLDPQNACVPPPGCGASGGDSDGDGICNSADPDDDNDGIPDGSDPCPLDPQNGCVPPPGCSANGGDTDGDGICNATDPDDDNDGLPDGSDPCPLDPQNGCVPPPGCGANGGDTDGDGICNATDPDDDNDGLPDGSDPCPLDPQNGCVPPPDCTANGGDTDGDHICNVNDPDDDNDGVPDTSDPCPLDPQDGCVPPGCAAAGGDSDGDGQCDATDTDDDGDGTPDGSDLCPIDPLNQCGGRIFKDGFEN